MRGSSYPSCARHTAHLAHEEDGELLVPKVGGIHEGVQIPQLGRSYSSPGP